MDVTLGKRRQDQHAEHAAQSPRPSLVRLVYRLLGVALFLGNLVEPFDGEVMFDVGQFSLPGFDKWPQL